MEYYCPDWAGTYGAKSDEEFALQHAKIVKALSHIHADIYALCELQHGRVALDSLTGVLNAQAGNNVYAYVNDGDTITDTYIKTGIIYRKDKVRPVLNAGRPYGPMATESETNAGFYKRELVQCFEQIDNNGRFVLSVNHFKSKSGGDTTNNYWNGERVKNVQTLLNYINSEKANNYYNDSDILVVGDFNCCTMEEPIEMMREAGYEDMLPVYDSAGYSYVYNNKVSCLDHVMASQSMAAQITGVAAYHINADEYYKHSYSYGETAMYRYSDHDPLIVGSNIAPDAYEGCKNDMNRESMAISLGCYTTCNVEGSSYWYIYDAYKCACMNGYGTGVNEDWLISPAWNMEHKEDGVLTYEHTMAYGSNSTWPYRCKVMITDNYEGDVTKAVWEELTINTMPNTNWQWVKDTIYIPKRYEVKSHVNIAFKYTSEADDIPAWEIKNVAFTSQCVEDTTGVEVYGSEENIGFNVYGAEGILYYSANNASEVSVYDILGRKVYENTMVQTFHLQLTTGVYIVKSGMNVKKVCVP